jgi:ATP-dependent protease ClpP protease subunit
MPPAQAFAGEAMMRLGVGLCAVLLAAATFAGPYEDGLAAFDRSDYATALQLWLPLAEQGHRTAQFNVAVLHEKGLGTPQDLREAARWYLKAAKRGDLEAAYNVATFYATGTGFDQDVGEARHWYAEVVANPQSDAAAGAIKQRARQRLAALGGAAQEIVEYAGGRFVFAHSDDRHCVVALQGAITNDTWWKFADVAAITTKAGCDAPWLLLESPGGLLRDGLALGREIQQKHFRTVTRYECASACALIFLAGTERVLVGSRAKIGFHQAATGTGHDKHCSTGFDSSGVPAMRRYVASIIPAHSEDVMTLIMSTPCNSVAWVSGLRANEMGIATSVEADGVDVFGSRGSRAR